MRPSVFRIILAKRASVLCERQCHVGASRKMFQVCVSGPLPEGDHFLFKTFQ